MLDVHFQLLILTFSFSFALFNSSTANSTSTTFVAEQLNFFLNIHLIKMALNLIQRQK